MPPGLLSPQPSAWANSQARDWPDLGVVALQQGFSLAGTAFKASIGAAMAGGAAAVGVGMKSATAAANFEQTKVVFATLIGDAAKAE